MEDAQNAPASPEAVAALRRARWISRVLDDLFRVPGTRRRVGLDPFLGLVPGLGDWLPLVLSLDLLFSAARLGGGTAVLVRMLGNVVLDALVGMVPLVGDLFDLGWKANRRNLALLEEVVAAPDEARRRSRRVVQAVLVGAVGVVAVGLWVGWLALRWFVGLF
ncbi:MAG: DUF4112 domain-containing protein [Gemmatimonadota bacterium]|nr:DUF4112 domain-containing protein [Gemmatimonadota bacterium]